MHPLGDSDILRNHIATVFWCWGIGDRRWCMKNQSWRTIRLWKFGRNGRYTMTLQRVREIQNVNSPRVRWLVWFGGSCIQAGTFVPDKSINFKSRIVICECWFPGCPHGMEIKLFLGPSCVFSRHSASCCPFLYVNLCIELLYQLKVVLLCVSSLVVAFWPNSFLAHSCHKIESARGRLKFGHFEVFASMHFNLHWSESSWHFEGQNVNLNHMKVQFHWHKKK